MMTLGKYLIMGLAALMLLGCGGDDEESTSSGDGHPLSYLQISPGDARVPVGFEQQFQLMAIWDDGMVQDVTDHPNIVWSSGDSSVVTIDAGGLAKGVSTGTTLIMATGSANGEPYTATATVEVLDARVTSLQLTPAKASVPVGATQAFVATATFSDGVSRDVTSSSAIRWHSQDEGIARVGNEPEQQGSATGVAVGSTLIKALIKADGVQFEASAELEVTDAKITGLDIQAPTGPLPVGLTAQLHVSASLSDGSAPIDMTGHEALNWLSDAPEVASVDADGLVTGMAPGSATITASGTVDGASLNTSERVEVSAATITRIALQSVDGSLPVGQQTQFTVTAYLSDGTTRDLTQSPLLHWVSSHPEIAGVSSEADSKGQVTGMAPGSATITASGVIAGPPFTASAPLTVTAAVVTHLEVTAPSASIVVGEAVQFRAMATLSDGSSRDVTEDATTSWHSDDPDIVAISNAEGSRGEASGLTEGSALISAQIAGVSANPTPLSVVPPGADPILVEPLRKQIASLQLSPEAFAFWNRTSINSSEGQAALKELTGLVYAQFQDEFDFITVVMNNEEVPFRMPTGEYTHIKNDVAGIGLDIFDHSADFHSGGKLQGVYFLYKKKYLSTSTYGPILHEMAHRWANWVVPSSYPGHWGAELGIVGQLTDVTANYADIELYLMGLMAASEMTDPASLDAYELMPGDQKIRVPSAENSQKTFRTLLLILSDRALTASEIQNYNDGATLLARTDNPSQQGTNFHKMTGGRGTLVVNGLDTLSKPLVP